PVVAPGIAWAVAGPALHHLAVLIELDHRRRRHAAFHVRCGCGALLARVERTRALVDPDVVLRIDRDAADGADDPVARQRLRPAWVDLEFRHGLRGRGAERQKCEDARKHYGSDNSYHSILPIEDGLLCSARS